MLTDRGIRPRQRDPLIDYGSVILTKAPQRRLVIVFADVCLLQSSSCVVSFGNKECMDLSLMHSLLLFFCNASLDVLQMVLINCFWSCPAMLLVL